MLQVWQASFYIHLQNVNVHKCSDMVKVLKERIHSRDNSFGKSNGKHVYRYKVATGFQKD